MKTIVMLCFGTLFLADILYAQSEFSDDLYTGGIKKFYADIGLDIQYPIGARKQGKFGTSLVLFNINPSGSLDKIEFLNHIGYGIENEVQRILMQVATGWNASKENHTFILPIRFSLLKDYTLEIEVQESAHCLETIVVIAYAQSKPINYKNNFKKLNKKLSKSLEDQTYKEALDFVSDLISINPFDKELYYQRMKIEEALASKSFFCYDVNALNKLFGDEVESDCGR